MYAMTRNTGRLHRFMLYASDVSIEKSTGVEFADVVFTDDDLRVMFALREQLAALAGTIGADSFDPPFVSISASGLADVQWYRADWAQDDVSALEQSLGELLEGPRELPACFAPDGELLRVDVDRINLDRSGVHFTASEHYLGIEMWSGELTWETLAALLPQK